jgi:hypothetical protein
MSLTKSEVLSLTDQDLWDVFKVNPRKMSELTKFIRSQPQLRIPRYVATVKSLDTRRVSKFGFIARDLVTSRKEVNDHMLERFAETYSAMCADSVNWFAKLDGTKDAHRQSNWFNWLRRMGGEFEVRVYEVDRIFLMNSSVGNHTYEEVLFNKDDSVKVRSKVFDYSMF